MSSEIAERRRLAQLALENAGREITQNFETMNSNMQVAAGTLAALLTVLGAGELFRAAPAENGSALFPSLSSVSLIVLSAAVPLLYRLYFRAVIAYQNLRRFNGIQTEAWKYLNGTLSWQAFSLYVELFFVRWKSPYPLRTLMWESLKYQAMWILFVGVGSLAWGFYSVKGVAPRLAAAAILLAALIWEGFSTASTRKRYFVVLNNEENARLTKARCKEGDPLFIAPSFPKSWWDRLRS